MKTAPAATSRRMQTKSPRLHTGIKSTIIKHREFIANIVGSTLYSVDAFEANPGLMAEWLKGQADGWEQYKYKKLSFELISRRGTGSSGSILAAVDYNVYDAAPTTEEALSSYSGAVEDTLWQSLILEVDMKSYHAGGDRKYVRTGIPGQGDLKTYDGCRLFVATVGASDPGDISHKLWVTYELELFVPETESDLRPIGFAEFRQSMDSAPLQGVTTTMVMDDVLYNGIGAKLNPAGDGWILAKGFYQISGNTSCSLTNGLAVGHSVRSFFRMLLNGVEKIVSYSGGTVSDSIVSVGYQLENSFQGCFEASEGAELLFQTQSNDDLAALTWLFALGQSSVILKKLG